MNLTPTPQPKPMRTTYSRRIALRMRLRSSESSAIIQLLKFRLGQMHGAGGFQHRRSWWLAGLCLRDFILMARTVMQRMGSHECASGHDA